MKAALTVAVLAATVLYALWAQRRLRRRVLGFLAAKAAGRPGRGRRWTHLTQGAAAVAATAAVVAALLAEQLERWFWLRIPLCLLVIVCYVPYAAVLGPVRFSRVRKTTPATILRDENAPPDVARAIIAAGRPWSYYGSVVMLVAVTLLFWHHAR